MMTREPRAWAKPLGGYQQHAPQQAAAPLLQLPMPVPAVFTRPFSPSPVFKKKAKTKRREHQAGNNEKRERKRGVGPQRRHQHHVRAAHKAQTVNKRQVTTGTTCAYTPRAPEEQGTTNRSRRVGCTGATEPTRQASRWTGTAWPLTQGRSSCIRDITNVTWSHGNNR